MCLAHGNNTLWRAACGAALNCYYSKASNRLRPAAENNEANLLFLACLYVPLYNLIQFQKYYERKSKRKHCLRCTYNSTHSAECSQCICRMLFIGTHSLNDKTYPQTSSIKMPTCQITSRREPTAGSLLISFTDEQ